MPALSLSLYPYFFDLDRNTDCISIQIRRSFVCLFIYLRLTSLTYRKREVNLKVLKVPEMEQKVSELIFDSLSLYVASV